jgi:hypothetical protein
MTRLFKLRNNQNNNCKKLGSSDVLEKMETLMGFFSGKSLAFQPLLLKIQQTI